MSVAELDDIMELSLKQKLGMTNCIGIRLANYFEDNPAIYNTLSSEEQDQVYGVADGLFEQWVTDTLTGRCSLQRMLDNSAESIEAKVDNRMQYLTELSKKLGFVCPVLDSHLKTSDSGI